MFHKFASLIGFVLFALWVPCLAQAQDDASPSLEEKFGGWYISGDLSLGSGPIGDTSSEPGYFRDDYERFNSSDYRSFESYVATTTHMVSGLLQFQFGYLFGSSFFIGPEISVGLGFPHVVNADARVRLVAPISGMHALDFGVGLGFVLLNIIATEKGGEMSPAEHLYIPLQIGYNYTYDSGFMIGVSLQMNITFAKQEQYALEDDGTDPVTGKYDHMWKGHWYDKGMSPFMGSWGVGLRLGYRFGHHPKEDVEE